MTGDAPQPWTDRAYLSAHQYRTPANLSARQSIYAFQRPHLDLPRTVLDLAVRTGEEVVVDVGCGNGRALAELGRRGHRGPVVGIDPSVGMLEAARQAAPPARTAVADACCLPVRTGGAGLVLAMHMLYHVGEPERAVAEFRQVLAARGRLVVVLNADDHLGELRHALRQARDEVGIGTEAPSERLRLGEGEALLRAAFRSVVRYDFVCELVIGRPEPLEAYVASLTGTALLPGQRDEYVASVLRHLPRDRAGLVRIKAHPGCLVCS